MGTHTHTHTYTHLHIYTQLINQSGLKLFKEAETAFTVVGVQGGAAETTWLHLTDAQLPLLPE